jgi:tetratricopeptide (TPR) repeat protein
MLGELLVEQRALTFDQLYDAINVQIQEAVYFLFTWTQGTFNFEPDVTPDEADHVVSINPESLLLEGARRVDEWSLIGKKIPSFDLVFEVDRSKAVDGDVRLTSEQHMVLDLIDGKADVQRVVDLSGLVEFEVGKALYGLLTAGYIHRIGKSTPSTPSLPEGRVEEHRNLGVAFYKTGMLDEALREFRRVLELRANDPMARFHLGLIFARQQRWDDALGAFTAAASLPTAKVAVFHNLAYVLEQLKRYDDARRALEEAVRRGGGTDPRVQTSLGVVCLLAGDLNGASTALDAARPWFGDRQPTPAWYHYIGLTAALSGDLRRAAALLKEGTSAYPKSAVLLNNYAVVLERLTSFDEARSIADRAIQEDAGLPELHKNVGDLHYRGGRYDDAMESYLRATKMSPELGGDVYLKLGNIRLRRQERDEAVRCWERALELDPRNAIVRTNLEAVRQVF